MHKKVHLDKIEQSVDPDLFAQAQKITEQMPPVPFRRLADTHLWIGHIQGFEVELELTGNRVQQATCECPTYLSTGNCAHIVSAMLLLRRQRLEETLSKTREEPEAEGDSRVYGSKRLTTTALLKHADPSALSGFLRHYAREHRDFALALRARFASELDTRDDLEKYQHLLQSIFNYYHKPGKPFTSSSVHQISRYLRYMLQDCRESIAEGDFRSPIFMLQALFEKLPGVLHLAGSEREQLIRPLRRTLNLLRQIGRAPVSPSLTTRLWELGTAELPKPYCLKNHLHLNLLPLLEILAKSLGFEKQLTELLLQGLEQKHLVDDQQAPTADWIARWLYRHDQDQLHLYLAKVGKQPVVLLALASRLLEDGSQASTDLLQRVMSLILTHSPQWVGPTSLQAKAVALQWHLRQGNTPEARNVARQAFVQTLDFSYLPTFRELAKEDWNTHFQQLIEDLAASNLWPSSRKEKVIARLLVEEKAPQILLNHIQQSASLPLLRQHLPFLLSLSEEELFPPLLALLQNHLNQYLGNKAARMTQGLLQELEAQGASALAEQLKGKLQENFSQRRSLMEVLG